MNVAELDAFSDRLPNTVEIQNAGELRTAMASVIKDDQSIEIGVVVEEGKTAKVTLSPAIAQTFLEVLRLISNGSGFKLLPVDAALTTQQAADLLNVSRPFLIKLLEGNEIAHHKVGRHRRIRANDLFAYKAKRDNTRSEALSDLAEFDAQKGLL